MARPPWLPLPPRWQSDSDTYAYIRLALYAGAEEALGLRLQAATEQDRWSVREEAEEMFVQWCLRYRTAVDMHLAYLHALHATIRVWPSDVDDEEEG